MRKKVLRLLGAVGLMGVLLLLAACLPEEGLTILQPDPIKPPTSDPTPGIVFVTTRHVERNTSIHQNWELYLVQPDGTGLTRLTDNDRVDTSPSWSPDGRQIVFRSRVDGSADIFVMDANGQNWRNLIKDPEDSIFDDFYPEWNPQRDIIALYTDRFYSPDVGCAWHRLAIMPLAGGADKIQVLEDPLTEQETLGWAPDGRHLAFSSRCDMGREGAVELFVWDIDTNEVTRLTDDGNINASPAYSHDGRYLAYQSVHPDTLADVFVMDLETGEIANLTNNPEFKDSHPTWSPDDSQIAFVSNRDGNDEIYVMDVILEPFASSANPVNLTNNPAKDFEPAWSPVP
ncbi:MAG: PD40 domain-containing protein [Anaerolineales bacterium]|nr:PD40 domain-containing protein [Anaerolineales bacterium]